MTAFEMCCLAPAAVTGFGLAAFLIWAWVQIVFEDAPREWRRRVWLGWGWLVVCAGGLLSAAVSIVVRFCS